MLKTHFLMISSFCLSAFLPVYNVYDLHIFVVGKKTCSFGGLYYIKVTSGFYIF